ncbi:MAG: hypothetical protein Q9159_003869 [Coniocarpon cinnabarinum]
MSRRARASGSLMRSLDHEVQNFIRRYLDDLANRQQFESTSISVSSVYQQIKNSNLGLSRRPRAALEDSIARVLDHSREELHETFFESLPSDQDSEVGPAEDAVDSSDVMNRRVIQSLRTADSSTDNRSKIPESKDADALAAGSKRSASSQSLKVNGTSRTSQHDKKRVSRRVENQQNVLNFPQHVKFADIGGMYDTIDLLSELVLVPLCQPGHYIERGLKIPRGILLHGPPGCGKTMLCEALAAELELPFLSISAPSIVSGMSGESEKALRGHFDRAAEAAPCLMFIDEIDAITPKRESAQREMERRIVAQLLTCMDDLDVNKTNGKPVIVLAATNRPDSLDPALRRAGRFDTEINIGVPDSKIRARILEAQTRKTKLSDDVDFEELAQKTPGFVGADLESLVYRAGTVSNQRYLKALQALSEQRAAAADADQNAASCDATPAPAVHASIARFQNLRSYLRQQNNPPIPSDAISQADFLAALPSVQPSAMREGFATVPTTSFQDVGALAKHRAAMTSVIINPIKFPEKYKRFGLTHPQGVLLYGPPGCGKTLLARAVARESGANFISVKGPELMNNQPVIVFFDELDALTPRRTGGEAASEQGGSTLSEASTRVVNTLLTELDSADRSTTNSVHVIAASNRPDSIDPAILRSGRLGKHLYVGLPSSKERGEILQTILKGLPMSDLERERSVTWVSKVHEDSVGQDEDGNAMDVDGRKQGTTGAKDKSECRGMSGADLESVCREAAQCAVERESDVLELKDLQAAVRERGVKASVGEAEARRWESVRLG